MIKVKFLRIFFIFLFIFSFNLQPSTFNLFAQEGIVAIVNKEIITQEDLRSFSNFMRMQLSRSYQGDELAKKIKEMEKDILDKLIEDRLILQEAKEAGLAIDQSRIKAKINAIKSQYGSDREFQEDLIRQGMSQSDLERKIREQLLMYYIVEVKVKDKIIIKPDEVSAFYNKNKEKFRIPESRRLQTISLENEDLAESLAYGLRIGQRFNDLLARYPAAIVNNIVVEKTGELRDDVEAVVFESGIGEISGPVEIDGKYYIFKVEDIISSRESLLSEAAETVKTILFDEKMEQEMMKWLESLREKAYIKVMDE